MFYHLKWLLFFSEKKIQLKKGHNTNEQIFYLSSVCAAVYFDLMTTKLPTVARHLKYYLAFSRFHGQTPLRFPKHRQQQHHLSWCVGLFVVAFIDWKCHFSTSNLAESKLEMS